TNTCNKDVPNCCTANAQCGKCETCDLVTNTCNKDVPNCCTANAQCGKCETCDLVTNTCNKDVPGCCTTNAQCGKCETCDLTTNTCNKDVPNCCTSDAQCDDGDSCTDDFCALASNTCTHTNVCGACCLPDRTCTEGLTQSECLVLSGPGNFLGIKAPCRGDTDGDGADDGCLPIPTVSEWGMSILALLLLIGLTVKFRRRSTAAA
ncbi:MAG: IPTL-CTERM sorting domain-containing protein, partial [Phycisphaerae bacterium]